jgi:hypothetical protein
MTLDEFVEYLTSQGVRGSYEIGGIEMFSDAEPDNLRVRIEAGDTKEDDPTFKVQQR